MIKFILAIFLVAIGIISLYFSIGYFIQCADALHIDRPIAFVIVMFVIGLSGLSTTYLSKRKPE
jgi:hypothetical protein